MKITLCGSTKFKDDYHQINLKLSKCGHVVYSVAGFGHSGDPLTDEEKTMLDLVHLKKIIESDCIMVVGIKDGQPYVGESTGREIKWALMNGKGVYYQHELDVFLEHGANVGRYTL